MGNTNVLAKGLATSEGKLAAVALAIIPILDILEKYVLPTATDFHAKNPDWKWLGLSLAIISGAYTLGRSLTKMAAINTDTPPLGGSSAPSPTPPQSP